MGTQQSRDGRTWEPAVPLEFGVEQHPIPDLCEECKPRVDAFFDKFAARIKAIRDCLGDIAAERDALRARVAELEQELNLARSGTLTPAAAVDVLIDEAELAGSPNFRAHTVLVGTEKWCVVVRREDKLTVDEVLRAREAEDARLKRELGAAREVAESVREWGRQPVGSTEGTARMLRAMRAYDAAREESDG